MHYAHSVPDRPPSAWEPLEVHARKVAFRAACHASAFGAQTCGEIVGWLHDLGKIKPDFQRKLAGENIQVSHSGEGAAYAADTWGKLGKLFAFACAGHHTGLPNGVGGSSLKKRLNETTAPSLPDWMTLPKPQVPAPLKTGADDYALHFFTRMLFSALVDADFLETEAFYNHAHRPPAPPLEGLSQKLAAYLSRFNAPDTDVNHLRAEVLTQAGQMASEAPGLFTFTVPTGGGKTLSSLKFALDHAAAHQMRRVIYVVPFTSIIEQTADVFRTALEDDTAILEHHSSFDYDTLSDETEAERIRQAAQNWDRPVVVTTAVQFFESLYANRTQKCRKLHNIAGSVIVLDEAQSLPVGLLRPCLAALKELTRGYGCSVVLCTATQPAIRDCDGLTVPEALPHAQTREIAPNPAGLHDRMRRVKVSVEGLVDDESLVSRAKGQSSLIIVNNKRHARKLFEKMRGPDTRHLSTNMTPAHRRAVLADIRAKLTAVNQPLTVVSTALVEAGVDVDFPAVWRAMAGLESIVQAAGRCNREGRLPTGTVHVFDPEEGNPPPKELLKHANVARGVLAEVKDPLHPDAVRLYFQRLYSERDADVSDTSHSTGAAIMELIHGAGNQLDFPFADIAASFRMISDSTVPLIISGGAWGMPPDLEAELLVHNPHAGSLARKVQPYTVQVFPKLRANLIALGAAQIVRRDEFAEQFVMLTNTRLYDKDAGFSEEGAEDLGFLEL